MVRIHEFKILHDGWELDNNGWVMEDGAGNRILRTTNHGAECVMSLDELDAKIRETCDSLSGMLTAKDLAEKNGDSMQAG